MRKPLILLYLTKMMSEEFIKMALILTHIINNTNHSLGQNQFQSSIDPAL